MATQRIQEIRRDKPTLFCAISTVTLGFLAIFGHVVSGSAVVVLGLIAAALISTKYNFKIVKIERSGEFVVCFYLEGDLFRCSVLNRNTFNVKDRCILSIFCVNFFFAFATNEV